MTKPTRCHHDRATRERMTNQHQPDCPGPTNCDGCVPCPEDHCVLCHSRHTDDQHPLVCDHCVGGIREDLGEVLTLCRQLRLQASTAANDGRLLAAAPIPGGDAMVLIGPSSDREFAANLYESGLKGRLVKVKDPTLRHYLDDHRGRDLEPPLSLLASWEDLWRTYLDLKPRNTGPTPRFASPARRASVQSAVGYLSDNLTLMAQITDGPDITVFARDIQTCRARLESVLHDESELDGGNRGVECFDCGVRLVRRIHDPRKTCLHRTPARDRVKALLAARENGKTALAIAKQRLENKLARGEEPTPEDRAAARRPIPRLPSKGEMQAARAACERCDQGGVTDPRPGLSWECPGCRKKYTPGEYHNAVKRDLLDSSTADGWTGVSIAAAAAEDISGRPVNLLTVRKWMDRGLVGSLCEWTCVGADRLPREGTAADRLRAGLELRAELQPRPWGQRLVWWPDVHERATRPIRAARRAS